MSAPGRDKRTVADESRDFYQEALAILKGESRMIPQIEHLTAVGLAAAAATRRARDAERFKVALTAFMVDQDIKALPIPSGLIAAVHDLGATIVLDELRDGSVEVQLERPAPPTPPSRMN